MGGGRLGAARMCACHHADNMTVMKCTVGHDSNGRVPHRGSGRALHRSGLSHAAACTTPPRYPGLPAMVLHTYTGVRGAMYTMVCLHITSKNLHHE